MSEFYKTLTSKFTKWVVEQQLLHSDFVLLDVGVQGGHHPRWSVFGDYLSVYGFDALGEEVIRLRRVNSSAKFHYFDIAVDETDGVRPFFVPSIRWQSSFYRPPENDKATSAELVERTVRTRSIDSLIADGTIPRPDFIKIDVEGHEPKVIAGAKQLFSGGHVLAVEAESGFTAFPDAPVCHFALISEPLHAFGFYLHNLGLLHATKSAMAAGRPRITPDLDLYFTPLGRVQTIDTLFCRDGSLENWAVLPGHEASDRILKLACILELYNLNDCAIELLLHVSAVPELKKLVNFSIEDAVDQLVPPIEGNFFEGDESDGEGLGLRMDYATYRALSTARFAVGKQKVSVSNGVILHPVNADKVLPQDDRAEQTGMEPGSKVSSGLTSGIDHQNFDITTKKELQVEGENVEERRAVTLSSLWRRKIVLPDGMRMDRNRKIVGWVDTVHMQSGVVILDGWAADLSANRLVDRIALFADFRRIEANMEFYERRDVSVALRNENLLNCGFRITLLKKSLGDISGLELRVFAESENNSAELKYGAHYPFFNKGDPTRSARRNAAFISRLLRDSDRRERMEKTADALRPKQITIGALDRQQYLDAHVPTYTEQSKKQRISPAAISRYRRAVIITFGQSNAANHGGKKYTPRREFYNFDFLTGDCFKAADPLLGASGDLGNFATRLGDILLDRDVFRSVLLAPLALGASTVRDWSPEGFAHRRLLVAIKRLRDIDMSPTHLLWHQGESEVTAGTSQQEYEITFKRIVESLRDHGVYAPIFVSVASRCHNNGSDSIRAAQRQLPEPWFNLFPGPDTDVLGDDYRFDGCHFSDKGLAAHAEMWCDILETHAKS